MICLWIEGVDNSGKTTLAKALAKEFDLQYHHCSKPKTDDPFQEYADLIENIQNNSVFDRGFLGEYVYSQLWRGGCTITIPQFRDLELQCQLKFKNVFLIHATAPVDVVKQRCIDQGEELLQQSQVEKCIQLFEEIVEDTTLEKINYDSSKETPEDIVLKIKKLLQ